MVENELVSHGGEVTLADVMTAITEEHGVVETQFQAMVPAELRLIGPKLIEAILLYGRGTTVVEGNIWACWAAFRDAPLADLLENAPRACARFTATLLGVGNGSA